MAARAVLRVIAKELEIEYEGLSIDELSSKLREEIDKRYADKKRYISINNMSPSLIKFLTQEADFVLRDKDNKIISYKEYRKEKK